MFDSECKAMGVAYGTPAVVIIEVHVHILTRIPQVSEAPGPVRESGSAVTWMQARSALVKSQVSPTRCAPEGGSPLGCIREAERHSVLLQDVRDFVGVPRFVARLECHSGTRRKGLESGRQARRVNPEVCWKLQQDRTSLRTQAARATEESSHRLRRPAQSEHMGQVATRFEAEIEVIGRGGGPPFEGCRLREAIEDIVDLDRLKAVRIVRQPFPLREPLGIQATAPVGVLPT